MQTRNPLNVLFGLGTLLMGLSPFAAHAADIHVPGDQPTIQAGIDAANAGDVVILKNQTYMGAGNTNLDFRGKAITVRSESNDPTLCIIDGQGSGRGFIFHTGETAAATVSGLTIQNGKALSVDTVPLGGGMLCDNASPTITNCAFIGNFAFGGGGMANNASSSPTVTNCTFINNSTDPVTDVGGGGMLNDFHCSATVTNCTFIGNSSPQGAGMANDHSDPSVINCTFFGNTSRSNGLGGGMFNSISSPTVVNCVFSGNSADSLGGGLFDTLDSSPTFINCTFSGNSAPTGGGIFNVNTGSFNSSSAVINCIFWGDTGGEINDSFTASHCIIQGSDGLTTTPDGSGNFSVDPLFVRAPFTNGPGDAGDLQLQVGSPAIDAGDDTAVPAGVTTDLAGLPRFRGAHVDLGAYEFLSNHAPVADAGTNQTVPATHSGNPASDTASVTLDGSASFDPDGDALTYAWDDGRGDVATGANPTFHLPANTYTFTLTVSDPYGLSGTATVTIIVNPATNAAPVANGQSLPLDQDSSSAITLTGSDPDGDTLTYAVVSGPTHGTLSGAAPDLTYTPNPGFVGGDSFTFKVTDPYGASSTATVTLTVKDKTPPVITTPGDLIATAASTAGAVVTFNVTATDNVDGSVPVLCNPPSGSLFAPGKTTVTCTASDQAGNTATATFLVWVQYAWSGVFQPINTDGSSVFKAGSTVPVKFALTGASASITNLQATLTYARISNGDPGPVNEAASTSAATSGNLFRYDASSGQYIFNWSTKGLTSGKYRLYIDLGDGVTHTVDVGLK